MADIAASNSDIRLAVPIGSSVLFYTARITVDDLEVVSGNEILLGGRIFKPSSLTTSTVTLSAENDVYFESGAKLNPGAGNIEVQSTSGNVTVGPNALLKASSVFILAPAGDIFILDDVVTIAHGIARAHFIASGLVDLTRPKITCSEAILSGSSVSIHQKASIKGKRKSAFHVFRIIANTGDVTIDRVSLTTDTELLISGANVTIGVPNNGSVSTSTITAKNPQNPETVTITATDAIRLERVRLKSDGEVSIETTGTSVDVLDSRLIGIKTNPLFEISATGAASTCDLTRTLVVKGSLATACDTVIGP